MSSARKNVSSWRVLRLYAWFTFKYPVTLASLLISIALIQLGILLAPVYLRDFFNILSANTPNAQSVSLLMHTLWLVAAAWGLSWVSRNLQGVTLARLESRLMSEINQYAFSKLIRHSHDFFATHFAGSLTHKVGRFARAYEALVDIFVQTFLPTAIFLIGAIYILYTKSPLLGLSLAVWVVLILLVQHFLMRWLRPLREEKSRLDTRLTGTLADAIANHSAIQLFSSHAHEQARVHDANETLRSARAHLWNKDELSWRVLGVFMLVAQVGVLYISIKWWAVGLLTLGDFVLVQAYIIVTFDRVLSINHSLRRINDAFAEAGEMIAIIDQPQGVLDAPDAQTLRTGRGDVVFNNVSFKFSNDREVIRDLSITVMQGERVALVGSSGAGKSTITKLLLRLYDTVSGNITISGQSIALVTQESLRRAISYVPQEPALFHRSLMENIRYGKFDASDQEVYEAAKKAHCHEFIEHLPQGYSTLVGERGVKLSGGERQRVAIARAILKDAPILVLDEATSSLDSASEAFIQDALEELMRGKTVIVIAHRLSTIMKMDRILVLENGVVVDEGTHDELSQRDGLYKKLWDIQAGGFIG